MDVAFKWVLVKWLMNAYLNVLTTTNFENPWG